MLRLNRLTLGLLAAGLLALSARASAAEVEPYLPDDTQVVVSVNFRQLLDSPLFKKNQDKLREALKSNAEAHKTLEALGFDPLKDLDRIMVAMVGAGDPEKVLIVAHGKFDTAKFKAKAQDVAKEKGDMVKIHQEGVHTIYEVEPPNQPRALFAGLIDGDTIVAATSKEQVVEAFNRKSGDKKPQLKKAMADLLAKANPAESVSILALGSALMPSLPQAEKIKNLVGGITFGDDLRAEFTINTTDDQAAKDLAGQVKDGLEQGKQLITLMAGENKDLAPMVELLDTLKVSDDGTKVVIKGHVTKELLNKVEKKK